MNYKKKGNRKEYFCWSKRDIIILKKLYPTVDNKNLGVLFGVESHVVKEKAKRLKIKKIQYFTDRIANIRANFDIVTNSKDEKYLRGKNNLYGDYKKIHIPNHPSADEDGYIYEHIYIMEKKLGRYLKEYEYICHIDKHLDNNNINNLKLKVYYNLAFPNKEVEELVINYKYNNPSLGAKSIAKKLNMTSTAVEKILRYKK